MAETSFTHNRVRLLYFKYRDTLVYSVFVLGLVIFLCFVIVWQAVVPQVSNWFSIQAEVEATQQRINTMRSNITALQGINDAQLDNDMQTSLAALPPGRDFVGILNAVSLSAVKANVLLDDYTFSVGQIVDPNQPQQPAGPGGIVARANPDQTVKLALVVTGSVDNVRRFVKELYEKVPVMELNSLQQAGETATITVFVHGKPLPPTTFLDSNPLPILSTEQQTLLGQMRTWQSSITSFGGGSSTPVGSSAAQLDVSSPFSDVSL